MQRKPGFIPTNLPCHLLKPVFNTTISINTLQFLFSREFRVVGSCKDEQYVNIETNTTFVDGDVCDPQLYRWVDKNQIKIKRCAGQRQPVLDQNVRL